jgi:hypothetical protein
MGARRPEPTTKAPWIMKSQYSAIAHEHLYMVVLAQFDVGLNYPQAATHTQMHQHGAMLEVHQQVLGAPRQMSHCLPLDNLSKVWVNWPAQRALIDSNTLNYLTSNRRLNASESSLDLW